MKSSLEHLPAFKRELLADLTAIYRESKALVMLILFGSHARGDWIEDQKTGYRSDFDLLAVVTDEAAANDDQLWSALDARAKLRAAPLTVQAIVHDILDVNQQIRDGHWFFADVVNDGILLYERGGYRLSKPNHLPPQRRFELALLNFREWYGNACHFWRGMNYYAFIKGIRPAMFMLNQAAERAYHAALLVFTAYKPRTHDLFELAQRTEPQHPRLAESFPRKTEEDIEWLKILTRAYVDARYAIDYRVTFDQLAVLRERVHVLFERVWEASTERLRTLADGAAVGDVPAVPRFDDMEGLPPMPEGIPADVQGWIEDFVAFGKAEMERREEDVRRRALEEGEARGMQRGIEVGRKEGAEEGRRQAQAAAVLDVLDNRGIVLTEEERGRISGCRDDAELARLARRAWLVTLARGLWGE